MDSENVNILFDVFNVVDFVQIIVIPRSTEIRGWERTCHTPLIKVGYRCLSEKTV